MSGKNVKISKNLNPILTPGRHLRLLCLTGKDKGIFYYLLEKRTLMGRGDESDILIFDSNTSKQHAEIIVLKDSVILTDFGTKNGTYVNNLKIIQCKLKDGDTIVIGKIVYKFQSIIQERSLEEKITHSSEDSPKSEKKNKKKSSRPIIIVAILGILLLLLDETPETKKKIKTYNDTVMVKKQHSSTIKIEMDDNIKKRFAMYIHRGVREYREENYLQAVREFDMALTLNPTGGRAGFYKRKAVKKIMKTIDDLFIKASRERAALRYNAALISLCGIVKLLSYYEDEKNEEQAKKMIKEISLKMGREQNDNPCSL